MQSLFIVIVKKTCIKVIQNHYQMYSLQAEEIEFVVNCKQVIKKYSILLFNLISSCTLFTLRSLFESFTFLSYTSPSSLFPPLVCHVMNSSFCFKQKNRAATNRPPLVCHVMNLKFCLKQKNTAAINRHEHRHARHDIERSFNSDRYAIWATAELEQLLPASLLCCPRLGRAHFHFSLFSCMFVSVKKLSFYFLPPYLYLTPLPLLFS